MNPPPLPPHPPLPPQFPPPGSGPARPLPDEPAEGDEEVVRVGARLPDGRRVQRRFLRSAPLSCLWDWVASLVGTRRCGRVRVRVSAPISAPEYVAEPINC